MNACSDIRILSANVINKIAAGEVVERPASVLKELMENAMDAGSTQVDVEVTAGGRKLIAVRDNGTGMTKKNAMLAIERHATSKISEADDIEHIGTLGFRGEALAAISAVSRFRLITMPEGETAGTEIVMSGGKVLSSGDFGMSKGSSVEVRDLFFNIPARKKFMRSPQTETSHIRTVFTVQAMARPEIGMSLKIDGRPYRMLARGSALEERLRDLFGSDYMKKMKPICFDKGGLKVSGYAGLPAASRADRSEQYVFVNGRPVTAPVIGFAIKEGYRNLIAGSRHAALCLFIKIDPGQVDVNVHPAKKEVRFRNSGHVRDAIIGAIRTALSSEASSGISAEPGEPPPSLSVGRSVQLNIENLPETRMFRYPRISLDAHAAPARSEKGQGDSAVTARDSSPWAWCRVMGQIGGLYVIMETEEGYVLMDPHAAHERILFERYMKAFTDARVETQTLLMPETVEMGARDAARVRKNIPLLKKMGIGVSEFGGDSFVVDSVPSYFSNITVSDLLSEISISLEQAGQKGGKQISREESIAQAACKSAIRANDRLSLMEIEQIVVDLSKCEMPYTCPHGRPTMIFTTFNELDKKFGRK